MSDSKNTTHIGTVTGQVHTGSGDIVIRDVAFSAISNKEEFLAALRAFKEELDSARSLGLPAATVDNATTELEAVGGEAIREKPSPNRITEGLQRAKAILVASTGVATASSQAVTAANKLAPIAQGMVELVEKIFR